MVIAVSKAPAMPMYWDAYLADTTHLTTEEHGAYMLLLAAMWRRNGVVPDDDKDNARILGLTPAKWRKIKARFMVTISGFVVENDTITQEKLRKTWENTQEKIDKNRKNGAKGGRATSSKTNDLSQANAANSQERKPSIPEPEPEPEKRDTIVSPKNGADPVKSKLPEGWVPDDTDREYALSMNLTEDDIQEIADDFHAYWRDRTDAGGKKSERGWRQTWRNRVRDVAPKFIRNRSMARQANPRQHGQGGGIAGAVARRRLDDPL